MNNQSLKDRQDALNQPSNTHLLLIPSYNTGPILLKVVKEAVQMWQPVWVVIDGSDDGTAELLEKLAEGEPKLTVLRHSINMGKGGAIYTVLQEALMQNFTHILTMDADGQHPADSIRSFMEISMAHPKSMILGVPVFDEHAPALRVKGRRISNFWANLETLWQGINDSLFGFRIYPLKPLKSVMDSTSFARRFDFDPEVAVRMVWKGIPVINRPVPVRYLGKEEGGISQFHYLRDNILLTWMHIRLLFGFILRLPVLIMRRINIRPL